MSKTLNDIKYFLKSKTAKGLQLEMYKNNIKTRAYHDYRVIYADGYFYAWFENAAQNFEKEALNDKPVDNR